MGTLMLGTPWNRVGEAFGRWTSWLAVMGLWAAVPGSAQQVWLVSGQNPTAARVLKISESGVVFEGVGHVGWEEFVAWGAAAEYTSGVATVLGDGSMIVSNAGHIRADTWTIDPVETPWRSRSAWSHVSCARSSLAGVVVRPSAIVMQQDRLLEELIGGVSERDRLLLANGDVVEGEWIDWASDSRQSLLKMQTAAGLMAVPEEQAVAVMTVHSTIESASPLFVMGFRDGSLVRVYRVSTDADGYTLALNGGVAGLRSDRIDQVCYLRSCRAPVKYLSELSPTGYRHLPFFSLNWSYQVNRSVLGGRIRSRAGWYDLGVGLHATCRIAYAIPRNAQRFECGVAIDPSAGSLGSATVRFYVQRGGAFQLEKQITVLAAEKSPEFLTVDVHGAEQLAIIVDSADGWDVGDRVNLILPRFVFE
ncbi:MAG: hypothetical protein KatS3mg109_1813 [Pirellulaceae bacterium]|nr:MAG: hypothetical protein KatS3mg109_1813 [Pirellulaceae bacterium]